MTWDRDLPENLSWAAARPILWMLVVSIVVMGLLCLAVW